jgi:(p)ppGpp synthase/HD superfamily hydrolase
MESDLANALSTVYLKSSEEKMNKDDYALTWLKNVIEWQKDLTDSSEFFEFFKIDLFHAEIFVFTPKGDLISLPKGATVLDFAFAVHTDSACTASVPRLTARSSWATRTPTPPRHAARGLYPGQSTVHVT